MYAKGGAAVEPISNALPDAIQDGAVSREKLKEMIGKDPGVLRVLEGIVHPLVAQDRVEFAKEATADILIFDIPLLFEGDGHKEVDAVVCVSISPELQKQRVTERGTMTEEQFEQIRAKQMPNEEKCARSDYVVVTDTLDHAREQVNKIVQTIRGQIANA